MIITGTPGGGKGRGNASTHVDLVPPGANTGGPTPEILFTNGGWSTSFEYSADCTHTDCTPLASDGVRFEGDPAIVDGGSALSAANNPNGTGGRGWRNMYGDGTNGGVAGAQPATVVFQDRQPEFWVRWYQRVEAGFVWSGGEPNYDKWLYMRASDSYPNSVGEIIPGYANGVKPYFQVTGSPGHIYGWVNGSTLLWTEIFGAPSDGLWHMIEMYVKMDTDGTDGVYRVWADGVLRAEVTNGDFSGSVPDMRNGIKWFNFQNNQESPANGRLMYVDLDDLCVYNQDPGNRDADGNPWIGPLNGFLGGS